MCASLLSHIVVECKSLGCPCLALSIAFVSIASTGTLTSFFQGQIAKDLIFFAIFVSIFISFLFYFFDLTCCYSLSSDTSLLNLFSFWVSPYAWIAHKSAMGRLLCMQCVRNFKLCLLFEKSVSQLRRERNGFLRIDKRSKRFYISFLQSFCACE